MRRLNADEEHGASKDKQQAYMGQELYDRYAPTLLTYLYCQVSSRQDAEDLLLEVFVAALNNEKLFHLSNEQQLAWLRRVARNKVIDQHRHAAILSLLPLEQVQETEDEERRIIKFQFLLIIVVLLVLAAWH